MPSLTGGATRGTCVLPPRSVAAKLPLTPTSRATAAAADPATTPVRARRCPPSLSVPDIDCTSRSAPGRPGAKAAIPCPAIDYLVNRHLRRRDEASISSGLHFVHLPPGGVSRPTAGRPRGGGGPRATSGPGPAAA